MTDTTLPPGSGDTTPIDAEFEPAPRQDKAQRAKPGWRTILAIAGLSLLALFMAVAASGLLPGFKGDAKRMTALKAEVETLKTERDLASLQRAEMANTLAQLQTDNQAAETKVRQLTSRLRDRSGALDLLERDLTRLSADVETMQTAPRPTLVIDPDTGDAAQDLALLLAEMAVLRADLEALRQAGPVIETTTTTETLVATDTSDADAALALSAIEAAARRGRPFQSGYQRLHAALPDNRAVRALAPLSATGALTLSDLREQFPALARKSLDTEAKAIGGRTNWMRSVFGDGIKVRRADEINAADVLDVARSALSDGNLSTAIDQIETLDSDIQSVFTDWLDNARNRQSLEDALEALRLTMIAKDHP